ncbi:MAG TPA: peptide-methionine (R)-S-oxide reductase MsrB [Cryomorphaceae bacterium]|nr:peptide-methionine (R)-S-oxide reductase MsrB [Cryomorphaceae bacterium]
MKHYFIIISTLLFAFTACSQTTERNASDSEPQYEVTKTEEEWKEQLTAQEYEVLREKGTERAFSGDLLDTKEEGVYICAACDLPLFESETKFKSGTGWPSFYTHVGDSNVVEIADRSYGMLRTEVVCGRCGGHLGHVFEDGPDPTGLRYCINSVSLDFKEE